MFGYYLIPALDTDPVPLEPEIFSASVPKPASKIVSQNGLCFKYSTVCLEIFYLWNLDPATVKKTGSGATRRKLTASCRMSPDRTMETTQMGRPSPSVSTGPVAKWIMTKGSRSDARG